MNMDIEFPGDLQERRVRRGFNISDAERWGSMAAGAALALYGLTRRRGSGLALAALGGALVQRGATGFCHVYDALASRARVEFRDPTLYMVDGDIMPPTRRLAIEHGPVVRVIRR